MLISGLSEKEKRNLITGALDKNIFVEAGAGAGKTSIMVSRIIRQLASGVRPGEIVAITFTNAATRELRERIYGNIGRILENVSDSGYSTSEADILKDSLDQLDQMQISTIHGFCHRILTERMFEAGLPVGFELVDENNESDDKNRLFGLWAEGLTPDDWKKLLPGGKYRSGVIERIRSLAFQLDDQPSDSEVCVAVPDLSEEEAGKQLSSYTDRLYADIVRLVNKAYGANYTDIGNIADDYLTAQGRLIRESAAGDDLNLRFKAVLKETNTKSYAVKAPTKQSMERMGISNKDDQSGHKASVIDADNAIRDDLNSNIDNIKRIKAGYDNTFYRPYISYAQSAVSYWNSRLGPAYMTNDMLIENTLELVKGSDEARRILSDKFKYMYVDEFQDTDHIQESFIMLLASDPEEPGRLKDGALFVVGDPKQSIYRFRGAEPQVYYETKERFNNSDNAYVVVLSDNYRSNNRVIDWVNKVFANKSITPPHQYVPMNVTKHLPQSPMPENVLAGVYKYSSPEAAFPSGDISVDAENLCRLINTLRNGDYRIPEFKEDGSVCYRRIVFSDFLIMCMNTKGMQDYADTFHRFGIPVIMDGKTDMSADGVLRAFIRIFGYLADPGDRLAREGAMESLIRSGSRDTGFNEKLLAELLDRTADMTAYGCIEYLCEHPEFYMELNSDIPEFRLQEHLRRIIQMTERVQTEDFGNRSDLLCAMRDYLEVTMEHELVPERDPDAVRFMNLHKAKGLEGNIVIWTNRMENRSFREGCYRIGRDFYPSIVLKAGSHDYTEWVAYGGDRALIDRARAEDRDECTRLEYVASTRAKQVLIFMDRYNDKAGNMFSEGYDLTNLDSIRDILGDAKGCGDTSEPVSEQAGQESRIIEIAYPGIKSEDADKSAKCDPLYKSESPSDYEDDLSGKALLKSGTGRKRPVGNILGTCMHRVFELVLNRWDCDPEALGIAPDRLVTGCIRQALGEHIIDIKPDEYDDYYAFLFDAVMAFGKWYVSSELKKGAERIFTEFPFYYIDGSLSGGSTPVWMHGEADLVILMKDGSLHVIDYKSDDDAAYPDERSFEERLRGKYTPQIDAYREAISRELKIPTDRISCELISFSYRDVLPGDKIRIRCTSLPQSPGSAR